MTSFQKSVKEHPCMFCIIYFVCMILLKKLFVVPALRCSNSLIFQNLIEFLILVIEIGITFIMIKKLDLLSNLRMHREHFWKTMFLSLPMVLIIVILIFANADFKFWYDIPLLIAFIMKNISIGLMEEIIVRGLILNLLILAWKGKKRGLLNAILFSSFLFSFGHLGNLLNNSVDFVALQIIYAFYIGFFFAAVTIRGNNIWPAIILHSLFDIFGSIGEINKAAIEKAVDSTQNMAGSFSFLNIVTNPIIWILLPLFLYGIIIFLTDKKPSL